MIGSALARLVDCGVYVYAGWEGSVASTKAFSCQVLCLIMIGIYISDLKEKKI